MMVLHKCFEQRSTFDFFSPISLWCFSFLALFLSFRSRFVEFYRFQNFQECVCCVGEDGDDLKSIFDPLRLNLNKSARNGFYFCCCHRKLLVYGLFTVLAVILIVVIKYPSLVVVNTHLYFFNSVSNSYAYLLNCASGWV